MNILSSAALKVVKMQKNSFFVNADRTSAILQMPWGAAFMYVKNVSALLFFI